MSKEAMKLALEALEESLGYVQEEAENAQRLYGQYPTRQARIQGLKDDARKHMDAITALREALAEQCVCGEPDTPGTHRTDGPCLAEQPACEHEWLRGACLKCGQSIEQPAQQEPVACKTLCELCVKRGYHFCANVAQTTPIPSPPANKPWVGLTEEDIEAAMPGGIYDCLADPWDCGVGDGDYMRSIKNDVVRIVRAIEAKLKEKNG